MLRIANSHFAISILDPVADRARLGPRFCVGGYVYQVEDTLRGPLFSGPEYPSAHPSVTNGQGMPDVFQFTLFQSPDEILPRKLIIGVGTVENRAGKLATDSHFEAAVEDFAPWEVQSESDACTMRTEQSAGDWSLALRRTVELRGRGWVSETEIRSTGRAPLPVRWFAHPFFPLNADLRCGALPPGHTLAGNPGFRIDAGGLLRMDQEHDWNAGCFTHILGPAPGVPFAMDVIHPSVGGIRMTADFVPARTALWGNARTFSPEPFVERTLQPGESYRWSIAYSTFPL